MTPVVGYSLAGAGSHTAGGSLAKFDSTSTQGTSPDTPGHTHTCFIYIFIRWGYFQSLKNLGRQAGCDMIKYTCKQSFIICSLVG